MIPPSLTRALTLLLLTSAGCALPAGATGDGDGLDPNPASTVTSALTEPAPPLRVRWDLCEPVRRMECARPLVPAHWSGARPDLPPISLLVKRFANVGATRHLWILPGGPGPSTLQESFAESLRNGDPRLSVYLVDHRGVGGSTPLTCPAQSLFTAGGGEITWDEWPGCIESLKRAWPDLSAFGVTEAAEDVAALIRAERTLGGTVHLLGGSYGTYWALRVLQLHPTAADTVTLKGVLNPTASLHDADAVNDDAARRFFGACAADAACRGRLGPDPWTRAREILMALDNGHCAPSGLTRGGLRAMFEELLGTRWDERVLVPAVMHRLGRCSASDVAALRTFREAMTPLVTVRDTPFKASNPLGNNVFLSELFSATPPPLAQARATFEGTTVASGMGLGLRMLWDLWPRYAAPQAFQLPRTSVPILMLQGELDPYTPLAGARGVADALRGPGQHFVVIPWASHGGQAPMAGGGNCQTRVWESFLSNPQAPDTSCVAQVLPPDFGGSAPVARAYFGRNSLWD